MLKPRTASISAVAAVVLAAGAGVAASASQAATGSSQVACTTNSGDDVKYLVRPGYCNFHTRGLDFYGYTSAPVHGLRWSSWGGPHPAGSGVLYGNMGYRERVGVRLSQRVTCNGHRRYKQVAFTFQSTGRTTSEKLDTCTD